MTELIPLLKRAAMYSYRCEAFKKVDDIVTHAFMTRWFLNYCQDYELEKHAILLKIDREEKNYIFRIKILKTGEIIGIKTN